MNHKKESELQVGIISQARTGSTRLPSKILLEAGGKTVLSRHINRASSSGSKVIIATTNAARDDVIIDIARNEGADVFRGSEEDVLDRYYQAARRFGLDIIVRITSDCPLIDGRLIAHGISRYLEAKNSMLYLSNMVERTYPRGFDFEILSFKMLEESWKHARDADEREHVTLYVRRNEKKAFQLEHLRLEKDYSHHRITLDTPEDWELIKKLIEKHKAQGLEAMEIIEILESHPELSAINRHIEQKKIGKRTY